MNQSRLLAVVVVLQGLVLLGQWTADGSYVAPAKAQIPDAGGQRIQMIDELKALNSKMDRLVSMLQSGEVHVRVANPDKAAK